MSTSRVVIEADGGSRGNPGAAAYGAVLKDAETGEALAEAAETIGVATNNVAEYRGLIAGLELAREHAPDAELEVRMDSKLVIEQMAGRWKVKHPDLRPLAIRANGLAPFGVTWRWVPRERNKHADRLVNEALDRAAGKPAKRAPRDGSGRSDGGSADRTETSLRNHQVPAGNTLVGWNTSLGTPTTVILLRHGETLHTADKKFSGSGGDDPALSQNGRRQAEAAAGWLSRHGGIDAIVTSPLRRARETAAAVAAKLDLPVTVDDGLAEAAFGEWDGQTFGEVQERWPDELAAWLDSADVAPPGGESFEAVSRRVRKARDGLIAAHPGGTVLAVSHVTPIKLFVCMALGAPLQAMYRMEMRPASLTVVQWYADGTPSLRQYGTTP
jgi:ribonuclease H / adenosylcobalamin/alpha-ribazole phosphatase